ncbi:hypothetical protein [Ulvibacterium sp.]|uniref:hypothetical protein n=1 Tax=Ulvibacterium sp. TaxID=2665914 RepID=UPI00261796EE|nr:hypothetical protein [Ulvibacterium sp.]
MKKRCNPIRGIFGMPTFLAFSFCFVLHATLPLQEMVPQTDKNLILAIGDNLVGGWEYKAIGAPEGYDKGLILIVGQDGQYQVQVQTGMGTFRGENVTVKKNTISFTLMIEGGVVTVNLTAEGSKMSGKSSSQEGDYVIEGVKSISPE